MALSPDWVRRYLARLAISDREPPTAAFLTRLHQAHVERIPWQTVDVFRGHPEPIAAARAVALLASGRSGYCFHLNTAFLMLLKALATPPTPTGRAWCGAGPLWPLPRTGSIWP